VGGDFGVPEFFEGHPEGEGLGNGLNRERAAGIAALEHLALGADDADTEVFGVGPSEFGDVSCHLPVGETLVALVQFFDCGLEFVFVHGSADT